MELIQLAVPVLLKGLWVTAALTLVSGAILVIRGRRKR